MEEQAPGKTSRLFSLKTIPRRGRIFRAGRARRLIVPPLLYRPGEPLFLGPATRSNPPGWIEHPRLKEKEMKVLPGDRLIF